MEVAFRFGLRKGKAIAWPRLEDAEHIMVAGSARPLSDALRIAFVELVEWLVAEYGFSKPDAYQLVSQVAVVRVANMVDPLYTVVGQVPEAPAAGALARMPKVEVVRTYLEMTEPGRCAPSRARIRARASSGWRAAPPRSSATCMRRWAAAATGSTGSAGRTTSGAPASRARRCRSSC